MGLGSEGEGVPMNQDAVAVSVIVPVYNSVEYLPRLLYGLLRETGVTFEVILVDDGSSDGSESIVDRYAGADARVIAVHQRNAGQCRARNVGMDVARGEYVTFCDNDDLVLPGFVSQNYTFAKEHEADCVRFGFAYLTISEAGTVVRKRTYCPDSIEIFNRGWVASHANKICYGIDGVWTGLYRRTVIEKHSIRFNEAFRSGYEDFLFNDEFMVHADSYALNPKVYYVWQQRMSHSTSATVSQNGLDSVATVLAYEHEMFRLAGLLDDDPAFCARHLMDCVKGTLSRSAFNGNRAYSQERELYEKVRGVILPYGDLLGRTENDFVTMVVSRCLLSRIYRPLYYGIFLDILVQRIRSLR